MRFRFSFQTNVFALAIFTVSAVFLPGSSTFAELYFDGPRSRL
jgi:hypothetical protein